MNKKPRILIVEDEPAIREGLVDVLIYHQYDVDYADDGAQGLKKALSGQYDLLLLDVMLPGMNGFDICEHVRALDKDQPIIMLTAKSADEDVIHGLKLGADDYVAKPFSVAQLVLRIQAVLRRARIAFETDNTIRLSDELEIDVQNLCARKCGETIVFTRREMEVLQYLRDNAERPVPREELLHKIWGYAKNLDIETRTVDIHIAKIRRKIEADPASPKHLVTIRGAGYKLIAE